METSQELLVVDSVGNGPTAVAEDKEITKLAFPIKNSDAWAGKIKNFSGDIPDLMTVYHSAADKENKLKDKYLKDAKNRLAQRLIK
jgi:hypothetical protein